MKKPEEFLSGMTPTKNGFGFMFEELSFVCRGFIDYVKQCERPVMDVACAYGVTTLSALENSHVDMHALDIGQEHLDILWDNTPDNLRTRLHCKQGAFPDDFDFADHSIDAIHIGNLVHFFRGPVIEASLEKCMKWLAPGGRLFINVGSIFFEKFRSYLPEYEHLAAAGEPWPGVIEDFNKLMPENFQDKVTSNTFMHVFKEPDFRAVIERAGFNILESRYYDLTNLDKDEFHNRDKGWVGVIAEKPAA